MLSWDELTAIQREVNRSKSLFLILPSAREGQTSAARLQIVQDWINKDLKHPGITIAPHGNVPRPFAYLLVSGNEQVGLPLWAEHFINKGIEGLFDTIF